MTNNDFKYSLKDLALYFLKLGTIGFGGPVALVGYMQDDLVEKRKWISEDDYKEGMALAQLSPGPLAAQLAIYLGYVHYRVIGATLAGICFVLPSFLMVVALGWLYSLYGGLSSMQAVFYGVGSCVIGIIAISSYKLTKKSIGNDYFKWTIFIVLALTTFWFEQENIWLILGAGVLYCIYKIKVSAKPIAKVFMPLLLQIPTAISASGKLWNIGWFFTKAGAFVFGSGLAIIPFLYGGVVKENHWLTEQQFLDAVAVAMITPGPVVITVGFIGYLIAGFPGACVAALATFIPCYVFTVIPAPYFRKYGKNPAIKAFVDGLTAAAVGAIAGAVLVIAKRQFTDLITIMIAIVSAIIILKSKKIKEPVWIVICAVIGYILKTYILT
ncbi:MAG TPA: chromate transporter [Bacteroidia bacterium]|nr:chromate transporter [Bacteroidia bacterium]